MDISIRITRHELDAIENYATFCTRWYHGSDPCHQCSKRLLSSDNCYGCDEHKHWNNDKTQLYDMYGDVLRAPGFLTNTYVKAYVDAAIDVNKAEEEVTKAQNVLEIKEERRMKCLAAFTVEKED
ncbi:MAG: hypothetical protein J6U54_04980 [Clostridiales bacterium]|nr:hypothetical protein [Clostridiales bacterium]